MSSTTDTEHRFAYLLSPEFEIVNTAGKPLTGGWIEVYLHGTRNKYYCFSDFDGTLHPFQIPLDSLGSNIILASPLHAYDVYIYNKFGSLVMSRYNIVPATNSSDAIADIIVIDSPDDTIKVVVDGGTNWHLEVNTDLIATASGLNAVVDELANKKDKQEAKSFTGSVTKTVKNISQDDNGVITVEYEDIDLPPEVPNVNITSPNGTINVTSSTDTSTNTKTFRLDVNSDAINSYYIGKSGSSATMVKGQTVTLPLPLSNVSLKGEDIDPSNGLTASLTDGLYLISYNIHLVQDANSVENSYNDLTMYFGCQNEIVYDYRDASYPDTLNYPYGRTFTGSFVREVAEGHDNQAYITLDAPYNGIAYIKEISIVKLNGIFGQSSPRYAPGYGIVIDDDDNTISVATGDVITHNYFDIVIDAVTGDIVNINESVTNLIGATGDYATREYVDEAVSGLENYSAGQYISIEDHTISATGLQPAGNYATAEQFNEVAGDVNNLTEIVNNITNVTGDFATVEYVDNRIATAAGDIYEAGQYISIEDGVIAATGLQPAGNYATEQYVDEAVAAVTGQPISQVQSDWTQQDDTKVDYIKHKPRQVNLVAGDNITIEQDDTDVIISAAAPGDTYSAGQYISIQNNTIAATGLQPAGNYLTPADLNGYATEQELQAATGMIPTLPAEEEVEFEELDLTNYALASAIPSLDGYATEQYVDEAVAAVTGQPVEQVQSDWTQDDDTKVDYIKNKPAEKQLIAGQNITIDIVASGIEISATSDVTKAYVDAKFDAATGMIPDISDLATKSELADVESEIPDISNLATKTELDAVDAKVDAVSAAIPTLPQEEEVEFEELNLSDYALASAIPDISNLATKTELQEVEAEIPDISNLATKAEVQAATGMIPDISDLATKSELSAVEAEIPDVSNLATKAEVQAATGMIPDVSDFATKTEVQTVDAKVDAVSAEIPTLPAEEEVEFEELDLSVYALASAIPDVSSFATQTYVDESIAAIPALSGTDGVTVEDNVVSLDNPVNLVAGDNVNITVSGDDVVISASGGGASYTAGNGIDITNDVISIDSTVALKTDIPDITNLATKSEVQAVEAEIPVVTGFATKSELATVEAEIPTLPSEEEVEFEEIDLSDYALASAIPDVSNLATKAEVQAATGMIPDISNLATKSEVQAVDAKVDSVSASICDTEDVVFKEIVLSDFALASAIPQIELNSNDQVTAIDGHTIAGGGSGPSYTAGAGIDIINNEISVDNTVALKSEIPDVSNFVTQSELATVEAEIPVVTGFATKSELATVEAEIPDISNLATKTEVQTVDAKVDAVSASIPEDEEVEFKELDLSDYALASAIPDVSTFATKAEVNAAINTVTGMIPDLSDLNTAGVTDIQVVQSLPASPVATVLYLIPEA